MRLGVLGIVLLLLGGGAVAIGLLPAADAVALGERVWPVLLFAFAATVVAELASQAGVFDEVASRLAVLARGRTIVLWLFVVVMAVGFTAFLSLDTTAVLLTPVVVLIAVQARLRARVFALTTVWLANTASLWLPVSNLTNLLALHTLGGGGAGAFLRLMWAPALVATLVPVLVVLVLFRHTLTGTFTPGPAKAVRDTVLLRVAGGVVVLLLPFLLIEGARPWIPTSVAAVAMVALFAWRRPGALRPGILPIPLMLFASGLFLVVETAQARDMNALLAALAGGGDHLTSLLSVAALGAVGANTLNNLPAYLLLEPLGGSLLRLGALLIGVNAAPLVAPWGSLATLLWHQRLESMKVGMPWRTFVLLGLLVAPLTLVLSTLALWASGAH